MMGKVQPLVISAASLHSFFVFCSMQFSVYNQLSNNDNLAIYLSIARINIARPTTTTASTRRGELFTFISCIFFPAPRTFMPLSPRYKCHLLLLLLVFFSGFSRCEKSSLMMRFNFFSRCYFRSTCAKCTCGYFRKALFDGMPHVVNFIFYFFCAFCLVEKENIVNRNVHMQ